MKKLAFILMFFAFTSGFSQEKKRFKITWNEYEVETHTCQEIHGNTMCASNQVHWNTVGQPYQNSIIITGEKNRDLYLGQLEQRRPKPDKTPVDTYVFHIKYEEIE